VVTPREPCALKSAYTGHVPCRHTQSDFTHFRPLDVFQRVGQDAARGQLLRLVQTGVCGGGRGRGDAARPVRAEERLPVVCHLHPHLLRV